LTRLGLDELAGQGGLLVGRQCAVLAEESGDGCHVNVIVGQRLVHTLRPTLVQQRGRLVQPPDGEREMQAGVVRRKGQLHPLDRPLHRVKRVAGQIVGRGIDHTSTGQQRNDERHARHNRAELAARAQDRLSPAPHPIRRSNGSPILALLGSDQVAHADGGQAAKLWRRSQRLRGLQANGETQQGL